MTGIKFSSSTHERSTIVVPEQAVPQDHTEWNTSHHDDDDDVDDTTVDCEAVVTGQSAQSRRHSLGCIPTNKRKNKLNHSTTSATTKQKTKKKDIVVIKTTEEKLREAERISATEIYNTNVVPDDLSTWSAAAAFFQLTQAMILFFLALDDTGSWYWFVSYPDPSNTPTDTMDSSRIPNLKQIASFSVMWLVPLVPLLSGIEHLCCILFRESYTYYIERHQNPFRWTEYTFSASLMKVILAQQVGITDVHLLVGIFIAMAISVQCAATHEAINAKARSEERPQYWRAFFTGWIGHLAGWSLIANYFTVYISRGGEHRVVWFLLVSQFLLDTSFAILFTFQWKKIGIFKDYITGEKGFISLSFTSKTILIWLTVVNTMNQH